MDKHPLVRRNQLNDMTVDELFIYSPIDVLELFPGTVRHDADMNLQSSPLERFAMRRILGDVHSRETRMLMAAVSRLTFLDTD